MLVSRVQLADAFIALAFGIALVLVPDVLLSIFGARTDDVGIVLSRLLGAFTLGYAGVNWYTSRAADAPLRRDIVRTQGAVDTVAAVIGAAATLAGTINALGWSLVALFVVLAAARLYGVSASARVTA